MKAKIFNIQRFSLHDGEGIRTSVFFCGCNLKCKWCSNPECHKEVSGICEIREYDEDTLLAEILKDKVFYDKSGGGVTLTGGEVFMQLEFAKRFCEKLREGGIHIAIETAGAVPLQKFQELAGLVDFIYIDCKHYSSEKHKEGTGISNEHILENIEWLCGTDKEFCVRIPVIPDYNDSLEDALEFCRLFHRLKVDRVELLPFHSFGESKYERAGLDYAYAGRKQLHKEDLEAYGQIFLKNGVPAFIKE